MVSDSTVRDALQSLKGSDSIMITIKIKREANSLKFAAPDHHSDIKKTARTWRAVSVYRANSGSGLHICFRVIHDVLDIAFDIL
jgi:hypothetical protein